MPDISFSVVISLVVGLFSAGVTWGVMRAKVALNAETLSELRTAIGELKTIVIDLHLLKASSSRNEQSISNHEQRIVALEISIGRMNVK